MFRLGKRGLLKYLNFGQKLYDRENNSNGFHRHIKEVAKWEVKDSWKVIRGKEKRERMR